MIVSPHAPGSVEWLWERAGIPTASEMDALVSPTYEVRKGEMPKSLLAKKIAEWWGGPLPGFGTFATEAGQILEQEAIPFASFEYGWDITRPGLLLTDDRRVGATPDGIIGADCGLEIKCPESHTHCRYILAGGLPADYRLQVQTGLFVTGFPRWVFLSYRRRFPAYMVEVSPDKEAQEAIAEALALFLAKFEHAKEYMIELNGGGPPERPTLSDEHSQPQNEPADLPEVPIP